MKSPARYLAATACIAFTALALIALLNYCADPLQLYRSTSGDAFLVEPARYRLPGLARHYAKEMIIAGTSVSVHQHPREIARIFGVPALNLAMEGASAREQSLLLRLALDTGRVKTVVWDIHYEYFRGPLDWVSDYDGTFPAYLYDGDLANDLPHYLLGIDTCKNSLRLITGRFPHRTAESFQDFSSKIKYGPDAVAKAMKRRMKNPAAFQKLIPMLTTQELSKNFERNTLALIHAHPGVEFHLYFPPFSRAYFTFLKTEAPELIPIILEFRADVLRTLTAIPNVKLHDLQADISLISDLSHYADPIHFDPPTHRKIMEAIHASSHLCTPQSLADFATWISHSPAE